jgi:hypothetical protein
MAPNGGKRTGNPRFEVLSLLLWRFDFTRDATCPDTRNPCGLFAYRIDRWWPKFHYARPGFELMITDRNGAL